MNHELWSLRVILIIHMERAIFYDDGHLSINIFRTHWNPFILKWVDVDFDTGSKNDYECWIAIESRKELVKQKMKIFKYFPNFKKKNIKIIFLLKLSISIKMLLKVHPFLPFLKSLLRKRLQNFTNWLFSMLYCSLKPPGYILVEISLY